jgi:hypothetical protein
MGSTKERAMGNNKDPNQKQPGEKEPGKFHYNPGNMSGKKAKISIDESDGANPDRTPRDTNEKNERHKNE